MTHATTAALTRALVFSAAAAGTHSAGAQTTAPDVAPSTRAEAYIAIAHLRAKPERVRDFIAAVHTLRSRTVAEPGVVRYELLRDPADRTRFTVVEVYRDKPAFDAHLATPYVRAFFAEVPRYLAERGIGEFFAARKDGELPVDPR